MAGYFEKQGDIDLAIQEYKKALKADEKNPTIHLSLGAAYIKKKDITQAIEEINRAIALEPDSVEPHAILALLYFAQEKLSEAGKEYERALQNAAKLEPKNISIYKSLGILYLQQKNFKSAEETFLSVIGLAPADFEAHFYLANTLDEQKKKDAAINELKKVLELKPEYHQALNYLGYLYVEENRNLGEAEKMIRKALEIDPKNGAYIDSLGWLYFKQGKVREAVKELEKAVALMDDPVIFEHLGDAYFKVQDFTQAKANWEKSLKLEPNKLEVKKKIDDLKNK
jgi:Tfp pilus assembly protein PilF